MCSKPEAQLEKLLQKTSGFYPARSVDELASVLAGRFRGSLDEWRRIVRDSVVLYVPARTIKHPDQPCFVQVRDEERDDKPKGYVSLATLAANRSRYTQVNSHARAVA